MVTHAVGYSHRQNSRTWPVHVRAVDKKYTSVASYSGRQPYNESEDHGGKDSANEAFPRLLRGELNERSATQKETCSTQTHSPSPTCLPINAHVHTKEISHDVIADHHGDRYKDPENALKCILNDEIGWGPEEEEGYVCPRELQGEHQWRLASTQVYSYSSI